MDINDQLRQQAHAQLIRDRRAAESTSEFDKAVEAEVEKRITALMPTIDAKVKAAVQAELKNLNLNSGQGIDCAGNGGQWTISITAS